MLSKKRAVVTGLLVLVFGAAHANAQRPLRNILTSGVGSDAAIEVRSSNIGAAAIGVRLPDDSFSDLATSITNVGDFWIGADGSYILVSGQNAVANSGLAELYAKNVLGRTYTRVSSYTCSNTDYTGICYSPTSMSLFTSDAVSGKVFAAPYTLGQPLPSTWACIIDAANFSQLSPLGDFRIGVVDGVQPQIRLFPHRNPGPQPLSSRDAFAIDLTPAGPVITTIPTFAKAAHISSKYLVIGQTQISVKSEPLTAVDVVRIDVTPSVVVGTGTTDGSGVWLSS